MLRNKDITEVQEIKTFLKALGLSRNFYPNTSICCAFHKPHFFILKKTPAKLQDHVRLIYTIISLLEKSLGKVERAEYVLFGEE